MTVYVDDMRAMYGRMVMCHMLADTDAELHAMAKKIGVKRKWYQVDHYDICLSKRKLAVKHGAKIIPLRTMALMRSNRLHLGTLGKPETALQVWQRLRRKEKLLQSYRQVRIRYLARKLSKEKRVCPL